MERHETPPSDSRPGGEGLRRALRRLVRIEGGEIGPVLRSAGAFFCLLSGYYILRPLREEFGANDREHLELLWTGTFFAMLVAVCVYNAIVARFPRRVFIPLVYRFFILNLLVFFGLLHGLPETGRIWVERSYYVWTSVFNLFAVTLFWGLMADLFRHHQGKRLFGVIAVGGTLGGLAGSWLTAVLAEATAPVNLLLVSVLLLEGAARLARSLDRAAAGGAGPDEVPPEGGAGEALGGGVLRGVAVVFRSPYLLGICAYLLIYTLCSTFAYFEQAHIVGEAFDDRAERTAFFARINLAVNGITLLLQLFWTGRIIARLGIGRTLTILPVVTGLGFLGLGLAQVSAVPVAAVPILAVFVVFQVLRRAANFALAKPAREVLFTLVTREQKYKSKAFIDTVVYRGGDVFGGYLFKGLQVVGLTLGAIALTAVPLAAVWIVVGLFLGRRQEERAAAEDARPSAPPPE